MKYYKIFCMKRKYWFIGMETSGMEIRSVQAGVAASWGLTLLPAGALLNKCNKCKHVSCSKCFPINRKLTTNIPTESQNADVIHFSILSINSTMFLSYKHASN